MTAEATRKGTAKAVAPVARQEAGISAGSGILSASLEDQRLIIKTETETLVMVQEALGSFSEEFVAYALGQLIGILGGAGDKDCTFALKVALAQIEGIGPTNEAEAMLAVQMVCAHHVSVELTRRCLKADRLDTLTVYGNLANKFGRTYAAQLEGLAKLRRGGEQVVRHVHVNDGGQAVIAGTVNTGGGDER
jgi:hypothetical protein